jgi:hypothetical protein
VRSLDATTHLTQERKEERYMREIDTGDMDVAFFPTLLVSS